MEVVEVEIVVQTITAQYGTLNVGDILRTPAEFANHLVDECMAAKRTSSSKAVQTSAQSPSEIQISGRAPRPAKVRKSAVADQEEEE